MRGFLLLGWLGIAGCGPATPPADAVGEGSRPPTVADSGGDSVSTTDTTDSAGTPPPPASPLVFTGAPPRNLLVLSLDTFRRDQVGYFTGYDTTPNFDAVARQSVMLEDHRSCSTWTAPSMLCFLTGYLPSDQGWWPSQVYESAGIDPDMAWIPEDLPTLATTLDDAGYVTLLLSANGVFASDNGEGIVNGFQEVRRPLWLAAPEVASRAVTAAEDVLDDGRPFYLHVHFIDPHAPYKAPVDYATDELGTFPWSLDDENMPYTLEAQWAGMTPEEQDEARRYMLTLYRAEYRFWDEAFGELWQALDALGALDDTLVVFLSDHGEQFGEHGAFHHGVSLFEGENRGVAFFWAKNLTPGAWSGPTDHRDLAPTILDLFGLPADPLATGIPLGFAPEPRTSLFFNYIYGWGPARVGVVSGTHKLVYYWNGEKYWYDLARDPDEVTNLYAPGEPAVQDSWTLLQPELDRLIAQWPHLDAVNPGP